MLAQQLTSSVLLFENSLGHITQEPDQQLICLCWHRVLRDVSGLQPLLSQLLRAQHLTHYPKLLLDEHEAAPYSEAAKSWMVNEWLPCLPNLAGFQSVACVVATDVFARLSAVPVVAQAQHLHLPYRSFPTEAEARAWLQLH
ncbi:hypothetical protein [Hymenobacter sp. GOD-10R]|uniref:hypothetical protein n=1 Tax=Hymenobacter sp. GOD-10R TaxID=3093922 RepID=UPI002D775D80|nr:hypothetical protein [Hymenobacter sp. GOD-10R]WRQ30158.1 hypothetical protein SD425_07775 [Hymenobacter sp. GOD-10R]